MQDGTQERTETYNGWTNRATWHTNLVISNDYGTYHYWQGVTRDVVKDCDVLFRDGSEELASRMRDEIGRTHVPDDVSSQDINWREIADSWLGEEAEEIKRQEA